MNLKKIIFYPIYILGTLQQIIGNQVASNRDNSLISQPIQDVNNSNKAITIATIVNDSTRYGAQTKNKAVYRKRSKKKHHRKYSMNFIKNHFQKPAVCDKQEETKHVKVCLTPENVEEKYKNIYENPESANIFSHLLPLEVYAFMQKAAAAETKNFNTKYCKESDGEEVALHLTWSVFKSRIDQYIRSNLFNIYYCTPASSRQTAVKEGLEFTRLTKTNEGFPELYDKIDYYINLCIKRYEQEVLLDQWHSYIKAGEDEHVKNIIYYRLLLLEKKEACPIAREKRSLPDESVLNLSENLEKISNEDANKGATLNNLPKTPKSSFSFTKKTTGRSSLFSQFNNKAYFKSNAEEKYDSDLYSLKY